MAKKYIDADRLIEYLEKEADKEFKKTEENANSPVLCHFHNGCRMQALDTIDFIKQLQQEQSCDTCTNDKGCVTCKDGELWEGKEQSCEDLKEEIKRYYSDNYEYITSDQPTLSILTNIARHFYELGKGSQPQLPSDVDSAMAELQEKIDLVSAKGTWKGVDVDKYMDEIRGREPIPSDVEEAASFEAFDYVDKIIWEHKDKKQSIRWNDHDVERGYQEGFKAGVEYERGKYELVYDANVAVPDERGGYWPTDMKLYRKKEEQK